MTVYKAYDIGDEVVSRPELSGEQIDNIENVISMVVESLSQNKVYYQVPNNKSSDLSHPVVKYNKEIFSKKRVKSDKINLVIDSLAEKLLYEEQVEERNGVRRRNKKIKEGLLFAKHSPEKLILLKFEEVKIMDKTTFQPIEGLSIDKQYYKIVVIEKNGFNNIMVVDKNKVVAKYWALGFLELERQRDSNVNTNDLIKYLEDDTLINSNIDFSDDEYQDIKEQIRDYIFDNSIFDKDDVFSSLSFNTKKHAIDSTDLFSKNTFEVLDSDFYIDKNVVIEKYKRTIRISKSAKIMVDNLHKEIKRGLIEMKGNKLTLTIDGEYKEQVKRMLDSESGR